MTVEDQIKNDEKLRLTVYDDATGKPIVPGSVVKGHPTIGYGRCLDTRGITKDEAEYLFANDDHEVKISLAEKIPWITLLNEPRQAVLYGMAFNMGVPGLLKFKTTLGLIKDGLYYAAAAEMLNSLWAKQVGGRADRLSKQMSTGEWQ